MKKYSLQKVLRIFCHGSFLILGSIILTIFLKVFCFASFKVPSGSMEPTLGNGDHIIVNKMILGPRIFKDWKFFKSGNWEMRRLKGIRAIKRNEVLVFNLPSSNNDWNKIELNFNVNIVKRCIGIPGDIFYIENGIYKVRGCLDTLGVYHNQLNLSTRNDLALDSAFKCFPYDSIHHWTLRNFGPFYIPKSNDTLNIDIKNIELYRKLIVYETKKTIEIKHGKVLLDGKPITQYVFKLNYYFMSGDNVFNSYDSRYWGLLPEDHIIGKVSFIWKSEDENTGKFRWKRFFKGV
jgi:signal peptidase I